MHVVVINTDDVKKTRFLTRKEAAYYIRVNEKKFPLICPVAPREFDQGKIVYDVREIDKWIDSEKGKVSSSTDDDIVSKLEAAE